MARCNGCGRPVTSDAGRFCAGCGAPLADSLSGDVTRPLPVVSVDRDAHDTPAELSHGDPELLVQRGPNAGSRWKVREGETELGRHSSSRVLLDDISVSRRHAVVRRDGANVIIEDLGSLNGTYLNGRRITGPEPIGHGDRLQIGRYKYVVCCPS